MSQLGTANEIDETYFQDAPVPGCTQVLPDLEELFGIELGAAMPDEEVRYQLGMFPLPTGDVDEDGDHQIVATLVLYVAVRGLLPGSLIEATRVMPMMWPSQKLIAHHVSQLVPGLLEAKAHQPEQARIDAEAAAARGEEPPVAGRIVVDAEQPNTTFDDAERAMNGYARGE